MSTRPESWDAISPKAIPSPAAGAELSYTVPAGRRGLLSLFTPELQTNATAANRTVLVTIVRSAHNLYRYPVTGSFANQTANKHCSYCLGVGVIASDAADQADRSGPLPDHLELAAGDIVSTTTALIKVGDQWTWYGVYKEMPA